MALNSLDYCSNGAGICSFPHYGLNELHLLETRRGQPSWTVPGILDDFVAQLALSPLGDRTIRLGPLIQVVRRLLHSFQASATMLRDSIRRVSCCGQSTGSSRPHTSKDLLYRPGNLV